MLTELDPQEYHKVIPSLSEVGINHFFALAVAEQAADGKVYADNPENPSSFLLKHKYGMSLLWGNPENKAFNLKLKSYLLNDKRNRETTEWLQVFPSDWNEVLKELTGSQLVDPSEECAGSKQILKETRVNFRFNPKKYMPSRLVNDAEFKLVETNGMLFNQIRGTVIPSNFWRSSSAFTSRGAGFSLLKDGIPVSTAFAAFVHGASLELGIETLPEFQGKGLAAVVCSALIDYCLERDLEPVWACRLGNIGSFKLAQRLGFEVERMIPYYQLPV